MTESPAGLRNKDGSISKMRAHRGNAPTLPQTKFRLALTVLRAFTRSTHLTRHMNNHTNERRYKCQTCPAQFTRSDLLARHRRLCEDPSRPPDLGPVFYARSRRCKSKGKDCLFTIPLRKETPPNERIGPLSENTTSGSSAIASTDKPDGETTFLPLESLSEGLADITALTAHDHSRPPVVHSHLSPVYDKDVFETLFTDVFSTSENPASLDDFLPTFPTLDDLPLQSGTQEPWFQELLMHPQTSLPPTEVDQRSLLNDFFSRELKAADPKHYLYLFFNTFTAQIPIVHTPTFTLEGKISSTWAHLWFTTEYPGNPPYLLKSMKACGAIFVRTRKASTYITESLAAVREGLAQAFANTMMDPTEQLYLVIAVVLLQTVGLWHQKPDERAMSRLYHAMLITMIRHAGLISKNATWSPTQTDNVQMMWREWAFHEMTKRALLLSYLHDCCQPIFFGLPPSYLPGEASFNMPCEDALWKAGSAEEWLSVLQTSSIDHSSERRLAGLDLRTSLASMNDPQFIPTPNLSRFCHFILIHAILRDLFIACSEPIKPASEPHSSEEVPSRAVLSAQYALHNWLHSWTMCNTHMPCIGDPSFFSDVLPFYWLGQVVILALHERLPPFSSAHNETGEVRFKMVETHSRIS
ncbi:fungal-specific transcription factor domain-containing protein [Mycena haematopus]|nr:fungal-specific transcription factor domain-containing protein [Mycena haematopus]